MDSVACLDSAPAAGCASALRSLAFEELRLGMVERRAHTVVAADVAGFAALTGDRNPIHLSEEFAAATRFRKRLVHGIFTAGLVSALIGTRLPGPGNIYISQNLNFRAPVFIGDTVDVAVEVVELIADKRRARLACTCSVAGTIVLDGDAWVKLLPVTA